MIPFDVPQCDDIIDFLEQQKYVSKKIFVLHGWRGSNSRPSVLETDIQPTKLQPCMIIVTSMGIEPIKNQGLSLSAVPVCIIQEVFCSPGRIRTDTLTGLSRFPLPSWGTEPFVLTTGLEPVTACGSAQVL
jgi:hypothetical protein